MTEPYLIALGTIVVVVVFTAFLWKMDWQQRSHVAQTVQALVVILALGVAGFEYVLHYQGDADRKRQAVIDILQKTIGSTVLGPALHELFDFDPDQVLTMPYQDFDKKVAPLADIYWSIGACAAAGQCDPEVTRKVFCHDFKTYEFAYKVTHPKDKRWQRFDDEQLDVFCKCENKHQFSALAEKYRPDPRPACTRRQ